MIFLTLLLFVVLEVFVIEFLVLFVVFIVFVLRIASCLTNCEGSLLISFEGPVSSEIEQSASAIELV